MKVTEILDETHIIPELSATDKPAAIRELAEALSRANGKVDAASVARVLKDREKIQSTAIDSGIAIPHGKVPKADRLMACLGRSRGGIDFESTDGQRTHLFFVLVAPEDSRGKHLKALARVSRLLSNPVYRKRMLEADDARTIYKVIKEAETETEGTG